MFACLMLLTTIIFAIMSYFYKYVSLEREYEMADGEDEADLVPNMEAQQSETNAAQGESVPENLKDQSSVQD